MTGHLLEKKIALMGSLSNRPARPTGMVPTMMSQIVLPSGCASSLPAKAVLKKAVISSTQSRQKKVSSAVAVPRCSMTKMGTKVSEVSRLPQPTDQE